MATRQLRKLPVSILPEKYQSLFSFTEFNNIQTSAFNLLYNSNESVIIATPTGSGKTVLAELSIIKFLESNSANDKKVVYLSPLKALSYEKQKEFNKYKALGIPIEVITGDSNELEFAKNTTQYSRLNKARLIISTIEKLDVLSRNTNYHKLFQSVSVLIIDEIHLLGNEDRGCVLELLLTRIRIAFPNTRIIGLSATIPNVESIASWLQAKSIVFGNDFRPSELVVKTIPYKTSENMFRSKYTRMFKSWTIVKKFLPNQSLVFVTSRGDTVLTAKKYVELVKKDRIPSFAPSSDLSSVKNENLRLCLENNIGFHHAGLSYSDKNLVEKLFKEKMLFVIVATSTLAWGINLPAKVVVIQDIEYNSKEDSLLLSSDIHQMLGRAGRPQFDNKGYGYVLVPENNKREKIEYLLANQENIQSKLPQILPELLLAEIIRNGRSNVDKLEIFLQQTLYWHQQESFPLDQVQLLEDMETELFTLENSHFIFKNDVGSYRATPLGLISNHYYVSVENASLIVKLMNQEFTDSVQLLKSIIIRIDEFNQTVVRRNEISDIRACLEEFKMTPKRISSTEKVLAILLFYHSNKKLPVKLVTDSFMVTRSFKRYWEFFRELNEFFRGEKLSRNLFD